MGHTELAQVIGGLLVKAIPNRRWLRLCLDAKSGVGLRHGFRRRAQVCLGLPLALFDLLLDEGCGREHVQGLLVIDVLPVEDVSLDVRAFWGVDQRRALRGSRTAVRYLPLQLVDATNHVVGLFDSQANVELGLGVFGVLG